MIKIGNFYYRNFWAFIQVKIFKRPAFYLSESPIVTVFPITKKDEEAAIKQLMQEAKQEIDKAFRLIPEERNNGGSHNQNRR